LTRRFNLLVTNDSGAMHIAVAQDVPVVAIFGPTTRDLGFYPYGEKDIVVEKDLPCRPCGRHGGYRCRRKNFACMKLITVSDVFNAVKERLGMAD
jgi:heptosyltransferase II